MQSEKTKGEWEGGIFRLYLVSAWVCMCVCPELLSFIPFDVLLSVNHGRTDASPLISSCTVKGEHGYILCSLPVLPYL